MVFALRAHIISAGWWVGTHDKKVRSRAETLVPGAGGKHGYIASLEMERPAIVAAETDRTIASSDAEYLVNARMVMHVVVDSVTPRVTPTVSLEEVFHDCCGVEIVRKSNRAAIQGKRPMRMVGDNAVVFEFESVHLARPN
jgi:hypothetical protein